MGVIAGNANANAKSWLGTSNSVPLIIKTNNIERMRVQGDPLGNIGIGDIEPTARLSVANNIHIKSIGGNPELRFQAPNRKYFTSIQSSNQTGDIVYYLPESPGKDNTFLTTSALGKMSWSEFPGWSINGNTNNDSKSFLGTISKQPLVFKTNNVERIRINEDGKVSINNGSNKIQEQLEVTGNVLVKGAGKTDGAVIFMGANKKYSSFRSEEQKLQLIISGLKIHL